MKPAKTPFSGFQAAMHDPGTKFCSWDVSGYVQWDVWAGGSRKLAQLKGILPFDAFPTLSYLSAWKVMAGALATMLSKSEP